MLAFLQQMLAKRNIQNVFNSFIDVSLEDGFSYFFFSSFWIRISLIKKVDQISN